MVLQLFPIFYLVFGFTVVAFAAGVWLFVVDQQEARVARVGDTVLTQCG
jgi:hypothetical protein